MQSGPTDTRMNSHPSSSLAVLLPALVRPHSQAALLRLALVHPDFPAALMNSHGLHPELHSTGTSQLLHSVGYNLCSQLGTAELELGPSHPKKHTSSLQ